MKCELCGFFDRLFHKNKKVEREKPKISKWRSFAKGCTWEFMCFFILGSMVYHLTGRWEDVTSFVVAYHLCKVVLYFFHERAWNNVKWGLNE